MSTHSAGSPGSHARPARTVVPARPAPRRRPRAALAAGAALAVALLGVVWPSPVGASGYNEPRVEITKSAEQSGVAIDAGSPLLPGDSFDYVLTVENTGGTRVRQVTVTDDLPATVEPDGDVTVSDGATVVDIVPGADPLVVSLGTLDVGDARTVTIPVRVVDNAKGCVTFDNTAEATYVHGYGDTYAAQSNTVTLSVGCADLVIKKKADVNGPVVAGDEVTFDIVVSLADVAYPVAVKPVVITDEIDTDQFSFVSASDGGVYAGGVVTWTLADGLVPGGPSETVSLTLKLIPPAKGGPSNGVYTNTACVALTPGDHTPVVKPGDDCDEAHVSTGSVDLSLGKLVNGQPRVEVGVGDTVTYELTVSNAGPDDATGVVVEDAIPTAVSFIQQTGGDGTLSGNGSTWTVGDVAADSSASVTFTATVDQAGTHTNVAEITTVDQPDTDSTPGNGCTGPYANEDDCAKATVVAGSGAGSLSLVKTNDPTGTLDGWLDGDGAPRTIDYTLTATAAGTVDQQDVTITDTVPAGTVLVDGSPSCDSGPSDCATVSGAEITWTLGQLAAGGSSTVRFTVALTAPTSEQEAAGSWTITNVGVATSTTDKATSNEVDNEVTVPTTTPSSLTIVKSNDPDGYVKFGDTITYTMTVSMPSTGTAPQTGVVVTDTIPGYDSSQPTSGTATYVPSSAGCVGEPPAGGTCVVTESLTGDTTTGLAWALGTMEPGTSRQVTFQVTVEEQDAVVEGSETVDFINVAAVESDSQPLTPSNEVVNTVVLTKVSDNTPPDQLPQTGSAVPITRLALFGGALLGLGVAMVRQPLTIPARRPRGRHAAR